MKRYWYHKKHKNVFFVKYIFMGFKCKKPHIFMNDLKCPVLDKYQCYRYVSCVKFCQFVIMNSIATTLIDFGCILYLCMYVNIYNTLWRNGFSYKKFLILKIISKEDHSRVLEIWLFWTAVIGSLTVFNGHHWQFCMHICQCAW